jgi:serine/threonine-protein kinase
MAITSPGTISTKKKQSRLFGWLIGLGIFLIVIAIMASIKVTPYAQYKNNAAGIRMKYPSYWKLVDHPEGAIVAFASPPQTAMDTYSENVNISMQDLSLKPMNLDQFTKTAISQMTGTFKDAVEVVDSGSDELGGYPAFRFVYLLKRETPKGEKQDPLKFMNVWIVNGNKAYIFTYGAMEKDYDAFHEEVGTMLKSFTIL